MRQIERKRAVEKFRAQNLFFVARIGKEQDIPPLRRPSAADDVFTRIYSRAAVGNEFDERRDLVKAFVDADARPFLKIAPFGALPQA